MVAIPMLASTLLLASLGLAAPVIDARQSTACFVVGTTTLPAEVATAVTAIQNNVTCDAKTTTIGKVPDVTSGGIKFSDINFATSSQTPLAFATSKFATATPLASSNLTLFQNQLNVYVATEAGLRSTASSLAIKAPKFFLSYQIARIKTAQNIAITDPGQTVQHLLGKVTKNAGSAETAATLAAITALSTQLS
ncbi:hypothetical protein BP6252_05601 [Coleophoma cylindrospora]|uniref:DUF7143 domain-containing protein n=1 Tax=Coleophoma cylindrospora TaxID=1849047 RepID=A0A3D8RUA9_9HELO|nr:hypothetical protein BP6252_05601 [Coleophoma cylindrospora]